MEVYIIRVVMVDPHILAIHCEMCYPLPNLLMYACTTEMVLLRYCTLQNQTHAHLSVSLYHYVFWIARNDPMNHDYIFIL